jgi:hypothetical protein
VDDHLVLSGGDPEPFLDAFKDALQLRVLEGDHLCTPFADEVMMMLA